MENREREIMKKFDNLVVMIVDYYETDKQETNKRLTDLENKIERIASALHECQKSDRRAIDEKFTLLCEKLEKKVGGTWP